MLSISEDPTVADVMREGRSTEEQLNLVLAIRERDRPRSEQLLEAIGRDHPDKAVSKAARKELFRLRSR